MPPKHGPVVTIESSAATILYALVREAGSPYHPPHGTILQLHVEKTTWHAARHWFTDVNLSPFPPDHDPHPDPADPDIQTINANALDFLASQLHTAYEIAAEEHGWPTNPDTHTTFENLPTANQNTMRAALTAMLQHLGITVAPDPQDQRALPQHNQ